MKDLLGRELKDGDLCIGMAIGRDSRGMHLGIFQGQSVVYLSHNEQYINKSCTSNTYLIANPTEEELIVKEKIQKLLDKEAAKRKAKQEMKTISLKELEIGGVYRSTQDVYFVYLGKKKVTSTISSYSWSEEKEGQCFLRITSRYSPDEIKEISEEKLLEDLENMNSYRRKHNIDIIKGNKKLVEKVRQLKLTFPIEATDGWSSRPLMIKIEDI